MKYLLCPDKFKGSLTAYEVCVALQEGILVADPQAEIVLQPLADGGDGSVQLLSELWGLEKRAVTSVDPLGRPIETSYMRNSDTAFIELAAASGLAVLASDELDPMSTSTRGTGLVIRKAIEAGCTDIKLFIGGSATNDAAMGIASALGYRFLDAKGAELSPIGRSLSLVSDIEYDEVTGLRDHATFAVVCDVSNPFAGPDGAAHVYARQKGADDRAILELDAGLRHFAGKLFENGLADILNLKGAGAAGGVGGGMVSLMDARIISGIEMFFELFDVLQKIADADVIVTGEGSFDDQSFDGKVVGRVCMACRELAKKCVVVCGADNRGDQEKARLGMGVVYTVLDRARSFENAMNDARSHVVQIGKHIAAHEMA